MPKIGRVEARVLEIIFRDEERRRNLPRMEGEGDEIYYLRRAATSEGTIFNEMKKDFEEWARRVVPVHPTPANVFARYGSYIKTIKKAIKRLLKRGLICKEYISVRGVTFVGYNLTDGGRAALMEKIPSIRKGDDATIVLNALRALGSEGLYRVRIEDIKRKLKMIDGREGYWNDSKIGKILSALHVKSIRKRVEGRIVRVYENPTCIEEELGEGAQARVELEGIAN